MSELLQCHLYVLAKDTIGTFKLVGDRVQRLAGWTGEQARFIDFCVREGHLPEPAYLRIVETRVLQIGREMMHLATKEYADRVPSPHALAYVLQHGDVDPRAVKRVRFDHGDTAETFYRSHVDTLVRTICAELRKPAASVPATPEEQLVYQPV